MNWRGQARRKGGTVKSGQTSNLGEIQSKFPEDGDFGERHHHSHDITTGAEDLEHDYNEDSIPIENSRYVQSAPSKIRGTAKLTRDVTEKKKAATKMWLRSCCIRRALAPEMECDTPIGLAREYIFVAYCCTFKQHAVAPGVFWTIFNDMFSDMKNIYKNPRIKITRQTDLDAVFPGLKMSQIPLHQDERFRYLPGCELGHFIMNDEWRVENAEGVPVMEYFFGPTGPPNTDIEEIRQYFIRRRDNIYDAFYNPWNPSISVRGRGKIASGDESFENIPTTTMKKRRTEDVTPLKYDIWENDKSFLVVFDAPGVPCEKISVSVYPSILKIGIPRYFLETALTNSNEWRIIVSNRGYSTSDLVSKFEEYELAIPGPIRQQKEHRTMRTENGTIKIQLQKEHPNPPQLVSEDEWIKEAR
ncbi:HSP20 type chaperone [Planoprotostelium fungivorum]|uniref:HSP20 type chaperone n=1 Tax=Planoprotostelium fungivorum TaxID=1890364 RepID=A0A2P6NMU5_9EUKA|nr:HSP20 type chaperone [Planoprotostelium fungivorum]